MEEEHRILQAEAVAADGRGQSALLEGREHDARTEFADAARLYRRSWDVAPPGSFGRLVGLVKSAVLAGGDVHTPAAFVRDTIGPDPPSPAAAYALALASLAVADDAFARGAAAAMRYGSDAFGRAADAIQALADRDREHYTAAVNAIVADFESRADHLTGVPIADTVVVLEVFAAARGIAAAPVSPLLP